MTTLIALGWPELGSVVSLAVLWIALAALCIAILRGAAKRGGSHLPRDL
jgi:hypothetical protein